MNFADLLTYADIEHLKRMANHYRCGADVHSKGDLIASLLNHLGRPSRLSGMMDSLEEAEVRFLEQLCFDSRERYSQEDLIAKGRAALGEKEENPRTLVRTGLERGWIFPGVHRGDRMLFHIPQDLRHRILRLFADRTMVKGEPEPAFIRNEVGMLADDLLHFLRFLMEQEVPLTSEGSIYRQQQRQLFKRFSVPEELVDRKGWRFGFGRRYHLYPDRFSLLYDYAFFRGYIREEEESFRLCLSADGIGKLQSKDNEEGRELFRFWMRLYKKPISQLPVIVRWIDLLAHTRWFPSDRLEEAVSHWLQPFYYETPSSLFQRIIRMMTHLGLVAVGRNEKKQPWVRMNEGGHIWLQGLNGFAEKKLDSRFSDSITGNKIQIRLPGGNKRLDME
ncbi:hypothetical protein [Desmospora activa]|uniref:Helicase XPB/Ssl2 N-terminal domain-containing protein n=1 Tax=Desmospora activa DSM 45169 TaxID=1121389 RepID=A0A2T4Z9Y6_9BACL|nr:hypothetical protein [Desmospora activa]PTM58701.1 hypothetical protein C8J48_1289 [Desmospora activa DSM 45169]